MGGFENMVWLMMIAGFLSGIVAGMGMGGGTILIPVLTIFFSVNQINAQSINLIAFIPCAVISLLVHIKNKLIDYSVVLKVLVFALPLSILGSVYAVDINKDVLRKMFGGFLIIIGLYQLIVVVKEKLAKNKKNINITNFYKKYKLNIYTNNYFK